MKTLKHLIKTFKDSKRIAVVDRREFRHFTYTYAEVYRLATRFVALLKERKIRKGDRIMVRSFNGIEYVVVLLGCFLRGVVVVPVDLRSCTEMVEKIAQQVQPKLIIQTRYKPAIDVTTLFIEDLIKLLPEEEGAPSVIHADDVAQILYTSGTTGDPKGVKLSHANFIANLHAARVIHQIPKSSRFLSLLPLSHVFEQTVGFLIPLDNKARIVYIPTLRPEAIFSAFSEEHITHAALVPKFLSMMKNAIQKKAGPKLERGLRFSRRLPFFARRILFHKIHNRLGKIDYFFCGGAPLSKDLEEFFDLIGVQLLQGYGLSETTAMVTANTVGEHSQGSVGRSIPGVRLRVAPDGEILIKGSVVTKGYYKNASWTRKRFKDGWFRTGDIGELDKNGFLRLKGRKKDMIVTQEGVNVYPEDIEEILNSIKGVKDSCVLDVKGEVHAVLLLTMGKADRIIQQSNKKLDDAQRITSYSVWKGDDFPRTSTMKVKKYSVREGLRKKKRLKKHRNKLYGIVSRIAKRSVKPASTLRDLGISSIDRVELLSLIEQEYNIELMEEDIGFLTKVGNIQKIIDKKKVVRARIPVKWWAFSPLVQVFRFFIQFGIMGVILRLYTRTTVKGLEHLKDVRAPVIFVANHQSNLDCPLIFVNLPLRFSQNMATAVWQEGFVRPNCTFISLHQKVRYYLLVLALALYPFSQKKWFRQSLRLTGKNIDEGRNIMVFPQGERVPPGKDVPFRGGIGIMARELNVPVVPIRIIGVDKVLPIGRRWPIHAKTQMIIGKPLTFTNESYVEAVQRVEMAVRILE